MNSRDVTKTDVVNVIRSRLSRLAEPHVVRMRRSPETVCRRRRIYSVALVLWFISVLVFISSFNVSFSFRRSFRPATFSFSPKYHH